MKKIQCEVCGSNDVVKQDGFYICQSCGMKYSDEEGKKLIIEVSGEVGIYNNNKLENLLTVARRARKDSNYDEAYKYYSQALVLDPSNWESSFYTAYCKATSCVIADISSTALMLEKSVSSTFMIKNPSLR